MAVSICILPLIALWTSRTISDSTVDEVEVRTTSDSTVDEVELPLMALWKK